MVGVEEVFKLGGWRLESALVPCVSGSRLHLADKADKSRVSMRMPHEVRPSLRA